MKVPAPSVFEEEMLNLFNKAWDVFPEPNVDGLDDATADAILEANYQKVHDYVQEHRSPLLAEFCEYYSGRDGDEGQLRDKDGSFLISEQGYPIQGWEITSDHRIIDRNGKQQYGKWYAGHYHTAKSINRVQIMFEDYYVFGID